MSEKLNALGVPPEYHRHAQHFATVFRRLGMTPSQIEAAIAWGAGFQGDPADLASRFDQFCAQHGIACELADLGAAWHAQVSDLGIDAMPQLAPSPSPQRDAQRLQEIEAEMRKPRSDSAYWQNAALRDEYLALLQQAEGLAPTAPSADAQRKAEIEQVMRTDRRLYERSGMDREYLSILERESGEGGAPHHQEPITETSQPKEIA
jgi:hypothetical protein